jgi:5-(carboxyamino)imidazole ribonucleotide synthase
MSDITIGIIGSGQLGTALVKSAKKLNVRTIVLSDDKDGPAQNYCDEFIFSDYTDKKNLQKFIDHINICTYEFENIPLEILNLINKFKKVYPNPNCLRIAQNRILEKTFVNELGIKTTKWKHIKSLVELKNNDNLFPGILKTCTMGYDGKGQYRINTFNDINPKIDFSKEYILEKFVNLKQEISVAATRYKDGKITIYEPSENVHVEGILKNSKIPANISQNLFDRSQEITKKIAENLDYVGTICVEFLISESGDILFNEKSCRPHNSFWKTVNTHNVSQFEGHVRAICGLNFIENKKKFDGKMINILGKEIEEYRSKTFNKNEFFFDYGKKEIKEKRKMGHLTILKK